MGSLLQRWTSLGTICSISGDSSTCVHTVGDRIPMPFNIGMVNLGFHPYNR